MVVEDNIGISYIGAIIAGDITVTSLRTKNNSQSNIIGTGMLLLFQFIPGTFTIKDSIIHSSSSTIFPVISMLRQWTVNVDNVTIEGNVAFSICSGFYIAPHTGGNLYVYINNSIFRRNTASQFGTIFITDYTG